jgi:hypothetical protein
MGFGLEESAHRTETETHCIKIKSNNNPNRNAQYPVATPEAKENAAHLPLKMQTTPKGIASR